MSADVGSDDVHAAAEVAYAVVGVQTPDEVGAFFDNIIGLARGAVGTSTTWTNDDAALRVEVEQAETDDLVAVGIELADDQQLDATLARLSAQGFDTLTDAPEPATRQVRRLAAVAAPWGGTVELVVALRRGERPALPLMPGGFVTTGQGFGHVVVATTRFDESVQFLVEGLGMERSDRLISELAPGIELEVQFFHCNPRHHSIALARAPFELPQRLHHLMFETAEVDDVGAAFDRAFETGLDLPNGLGRHDNDGMFSFYVRSPAGFLVEVGHGARTVGADWDDDRVYDRISRWGHQPVAARDAAAAS
jgi:2,3-dihydroxybiphenyl 1,2-dioxygenase